MNTEVIGKSQGVEDKSGKNVKVVMNQIQIFPLHTISILTFELCNTWVRPFIWRTSSKGTHKLSQTLNAVVYYLAK